MSDEPLPQSEIILYQTEDGRTRIQSRLPDGVVRRTGRWTIERFADSAARAKPLIQR